MSEAHYYTNRNLTTDTGFISTLGASIEGWISEANSVAGHSITFEVKFLARSGVTSQILVDTFDVIINGDNSTATIEGAAIDLLAQGAGQALATALIASGLGLVGISASPLAVSIAAATSVSYLYSTFLEPIVDQTLDELMGTVDYDLQLFSPNNGGTQVGGALYKDGLGATTLDTAINNLIVQAQQSIDPDVGVGSKIVVKHGSSTQSEYVFYDDYALKKIARDLYPTLSTDQLALDQIKNIDNENGRIIKVINGQQYLLASADDMLHMPITPGSTTHPTQYGLSEFHLSAIRYGRDGPGPQNAKLTGDHGLVANDLLVGDLNDNEIQGYTGNDTLIGGAGKDWLYGGIGNDTLYGDLTGNGTGTDTLDGGDGNDKIDGGGGIDTVTAGTGNDVIYGHGGITGLDGDNYNGGAAGLAAAQDGVDTVNYSDLGFGIRVEIHNGTGTVQKWDKATGAVFGPIDTLTSIEAVVGSSHDDLFITDDPNIVFYGGPGNDTYVLNTNGTSWWHQIVENPNDQGYDVLVVPGATPGNTHGTRTPDGIYVEPEPAGGGGGGGPSAPFFIPNQAPAAPPGGPAAPGGGPSGGGGGTGGGVDAVAPTPTGTPVDPNDFVDDDDEDDEDDESPVTQTPAVPFADPLMLDLDGDGLELISEENSRVYFDHLGDGFAEHTAWISGDDGILVWDKNNNGIIGAGELIGSDKPLAMVLDRGTVYTEDNGFSYLKNYDDNHDGKISSLDTIYASLRVWKDLNGNAVNESGELLTLSALNIASINLNNVTIYAIQNPQLGFPSRIIEENILTHAGTFTRNDNSTGEIADVWLGANYQSSVYTGNYDLNPQALLSATLRGYGQLKNLHVETSLNEDLLEKVVDFKGSRTLSQWFSDDQNVKNDVRDILLEWANVNLNERSVREDGYFSLSPEFYFLKAWTGTDHPYLGTWFNGTTRLPITHAGMDAINKSWNELLESYSAKLIFQSGGNSLFQPGAFYNPYLDRFDGGLRLLQSAVTDLGTAAAGASDKEGFWHSTLSYIQNTLGLANLTTTEIGWLTSAIQTSSGGTLTWNGMLVTLRDNEINGTDAAADTLAGTRWSDVIAGGAGNDILSGGAGNDWLNGGNDNDTLSGGQGNDILEGGRGNDIYIYDSGNDVIAEVGGNFINDIDTIKFATGITLADLSFHLSRVETATRQQFYITVNNHGTIAINDDTGGNLPSYGLIDKLQFADSSIVNLSDMNVTIHGTKENDGLSSIAYNGVTTYLGYEGNDTFYIQSGTSIIDGGSGDDYATGGIGNDTYIVSSGIDTIIDAAGSDTIKVGVGYELEDVHFYRTNKPGNSGGTYIDASIVVDGLGTLVISNQFDHGITSYQTAIENLVLADGTTVNLLTQVYETLGTAGNDTLYGVGAWAQKNDIYQFTQGSDALYEYQGFDVLKFSSGITAANITIQRINNGGADVAWDNLLIKDANGNSFIVHDHFKNQDYSLEQLKFSDNSTIDLTTYIINTYGTENADSISASNAGNTGFNGAIYGYGGNDTIYGGVNNETIYGGNGNDYIGGDAGADTLYGDDGIDTLFGDAGNDTLQGGIGNDTLYGGLDSDSLIGGDGDDYLYGDQTTGTYTGGNDTLEGGIGNDYLFGGQGLDVYKYTSGNDIIDGEFYANNGDKIILPTGITLSNLTFARTGSSQDLLITVGSLGTITIKGQIDIGAVSYGIETIQFADNSTINLPTLNNVITLGTSGDDTLYGINNGVGTNDILDSGAGNDKLYGQTGSDTYRYTSGYDEIRDTGGTDKVILAAGIAAGDVTIFNAGDDDILININSSTIKGQIFLYDHRNASNTYKIETLQLANNATIAITGSNTVNQIYGTTVGETINGNVSQNDTLNGLGGDDTLNGYSGNDTLIGGAGDDDLFGGDGNDTYQFTSGLDEIWDTAGTDTILLAQGIVAANIVMVNIGNYDFMINFTGAVSGTIIIHDHRTAAGAIETLRLYDNSTVALVANNLTHEIYGTSAANTLYGDISGVADDTIYGLDGGDSIYSYAGNDKIFGGNGIDYIDGGTGNDIIYGDDGDDALYDQDGNDTFYGGLGNDNIDGHNGSDLIYGGDGNDTIYGGRYAGTSDSADTIYGDVGIDTIYGNAGNDFIYGGSENDNLYGDDGDDLLQGDTGNDRLYGGAGNDTYVFGTGQDTVYEQVSGVDSIKFANGVTLGSITFERVVDVTNDNNNLRIKDGFGNALFLENQFYQYDTAYRIEQLVFSTGVVNFSDLQITTTGTDNSNTIHGILNGGASANDIIDGRGGSDAIYGYGGNDMLLGGLGNDTLDGGDGNDTLNGEAGSDSMNGGLGNDTYVFGTGFGIDYVYEDVAAGTDTVSFINGITQNDLYMWTDNYGQLHIRTIADVNNEVIISASLGATGTTVNTRIERITFDNGTILDISLGLILNDSDDAHSIYASAQNDTINGRGGNDAISGYGGNDTLLGGLGSDSLDGGDGNDTLNGEAGSDSLIGGLGNDTYVFGTGFGLDYVYDDISSGTDTLYFTNGITQNDLYMWTDNYGQLHIRTITDVNNEVVVSASLGTTGTTVNSRIERITFDNGTILDISLGLILNDSDDAHSIYASAQNDTINGRGGNDAISGYGGNDTLLGGLGSDSLDGGDGNDTLNGEAGSDSLIGGLGNDTYVFGTGFGLDYVYEDTASGDDIIQFTNLVAPEDIRSWVDNYGQLHILLADSPADHVTFSASLGSTGTTISDRIERIVFENGTIWNLTQGLTLNDTDDAHSIYASAQSDTVNGRGGNDSISGYGGNDTLSGDLGDDSIEGGSGNDILSGDAGRDTLIGGSGDDTYMFERGFSGGSTGGFESVIENSGEGFDTIIFSEGILPSELLSWTDSYGRMFFQLATDSANNTFYIHGAFSGYTGVNSYVENILFKEGNVTLNLAQGLLLNDTSDSRELYGSAQSDIINGNAGNDYLYGYDGNDVLDGGLGNDYMVGGLGNDTYVIDSASDSISENANEGTDTIQIGMTYTLLANYENLTLTGTATINGTGNSANNIIIGNSANNTLTGGDGNDTLDGGLGNDTMVGGLGNDIFVVDSTTDVLTETSGAGTDTVQSYITLTLATNFENLTLIGTANINGTGNSGVNILIGNSGNNTLSGGSGADTMSGGKGDDIYVVDNASDVVNENISEGMDTVQTVLTYALLSNFENLTLTGSAAVNGTGNSLDNILIGNTGNNTLTGGGGNDTLNGGSGSDTMIGGIGNDIYVIDNVSDVVTELTNEGTDTIQTNLTYTLLANFENLTLTGSTAINATGNSLDNTLIGNTGNNTLTGGDGNDTLDGGAGNDTMIGGLGNDIYVIGSSSDVVTESANQGTDTVRSSITYTLLADFENLTLIGTSNINGAGNAGNNTLIGNIGNNTLSGLAGNDTMSGLAGNDTYVVDSISDVVTENENEGTDLIQSSVTYTLLNNVENLTLTGSAAIHATGNALDNILTGNTGNNTLTGGGGNDTLNGGSGSDTMIGGTGGDIYLVNVTGDIVTENVNEGIDTVQSGVAYTLGNNVENLTLTGTGNIAGTGNDLDNTLTGNSGNNTLSGGIGNDTLNGGSGLDTMTGGVGSDVFVFEAANAFSNVDIVQDFNTGQSDKLNIQDLLVGYTAGVSNIDDFVTVTTVGSNTSFLIDRDGAGSTYSDTAIATLNSITGLTVSDLFNNGHLIV